MARRPARRNHRALRTTRLSSGASAACKRRDQRLRAIELLVAQAGPSARRHAARRSRRAGVWQARRESGRNRGARPAAAGLRPRAAQQRQFERLDRALERARRAAEPAQRMLQQRQQGRRLQLASPPPPRRAARKCPPACPSARRRRNRRRRDSSGRAPRSPAAPARDPASPAPPICRDAAPRASRPRSRAPPSRDCRPRSRRDLLMPPEIFAAIVGLAPAAVPLRGRVRGPHRLGHQHLAPARRRLRRGFRRRRA